MCRVHRADRGRVRSVDGGVLAEHRPPDVAEASDKDDRGGVVVIGGDAATPGAVILVALAALRSGAGRAHVITDASATTAMAVANPELRVSALPEHERLEDVRALVASIEHADA